MVMSRSVRVAVSALALMLGATGANAQQILTALNTDLDDGESIDLISTTAGQQISYSNAGNENRAVTNYGVNKIYANAIGGVEQSSTSAWLDTYTAGGVAGSKVRLTFTFTIDGQTQFGTYEDPSWKPDYNFKVYAMRGTGWTMYGDGNNGGPGLYPSLGTGDDYDTLFMQRMNINGGFEQLRMRDENGAMYNYQNAGGQPGNFASQVRYDEAGDFYAITTMNPQGFPTTGYYYKTFFRSGNPNGPVSPPIPYDGNAPQAPTLAQVRANLENNFSVLDFAQLCSDTSGTCIERTYEPTPLTLSFEVAAGSQFTLAAWLFSDSVTDGSVDFFNTAKVTGITAFNAANGAQVSLTSGSGTLVTLPGGGFGYPQPNAAVPEPATWAMMIGGLGLIGGAMRRRRVANVVCA